MELFKTFVLQFDENFDFSKIKKINKKYFLVRDFNNIILEKIDEEDIISSGLLLGEDKNKKFNASINLLNALSKTERFIKLNKQASWLFICGRDVFSENIIDQGHVYNTVIVKNNYGEVIGLAKRDKKDKSLFKNFYDIGHFLRREHNKR